MALARLALRAVARASGSLTPELRPLLHLSAHLSQLRTLPLHQATTSRAICSCNPLRDADTTSASFPTASSGRDRNMAIVFTCTKCDTRSAKTFSRQSYENGIVLIRCPGCKNLHLVADNLGWFGEHKFKIEDLASEVGVRRVDATGQAAAELSVQLSAEDVAGWSRVEAIAAAAAGGAPTASTQHAAGMELDQEEVLQLDPADLEAWSRVRKQGDGTPGSSQ